MKKKIIIGLVTLALVGVALFQVVPALADTPNPLDHVVISPTATTLPVGSQQLFTAQAQDSSNQTVTGVTYFWLVTAGGGTITPNAASATFTAGGTPGTYTNTVEVVAVQNSITKVAAATVTVTGTPGALDHVSVTPANVTMAQGGTQQFTAQGFDAANIAIGGLSYSWSAQNAAGSITAVNNNVITFTAGANTGTFTNAIMASTTSGSISRSATANVIVATPPVSTPTPTPGFDTAKLIKMFGGLLNKVGFENFLGGQWQVKNGANIDTIKAIPGVVQAAPSGTPQNLVVLPNGQSANVTFTLSGTTVILPKGTTLAANQKVVVITVNDVVRVVAVVTPTSTGRMPPGLKKQDEDKREGKQTPPGWSHGKKTGWGHGEGNQGRGEDDQGQNEDD